MASPCNRTRTELDERLRESGFGTHVDMFTCFFRRSTADEAAVAAAAAATDKTAAVPAGTILCMSCGLTIGAHGNDASSVVGTVTDVRTVDGAAVEPISSGVDYPSANDDRVGLLSGGGAAGSAPSADDAAMDEECTPPMMPPGMTVLPKFDQLRLNSSGIALKIFSALSLVSAGYSGYLVSGFWLADWGFGWSFAGSYGLFFSLVACVFFFGSLYGNIVYFRVARLEDHEPSTARAYGERPLWQDGLTQVLCGGDPNFAMHFKAKDVKSVQLDHNALSPGSTARIWLNMKPSQAAQQSAANGRTTTTTTTSTATVTETTTTTRGPVLIIFTGKCRDPRGRAEAWREYLRPNAPGQLAHVDGLNI